MILAVLLMGGALLFDTTIETGSGGVYGAPERVHNLGAMQLQELFFLAGVGFLIAGAVLYGFGELAERMERAGTAQAETSTAALNTGPEANQCAWCDRDMSPYRPCSSATEDKNRERAPRIKDPACVAQFQERGFLPGS